MNHYLSKQEYQKPELEVASIIYTSIIAASGVDGDNHDFEFSEWDWTY